MPKQRGRSNTTLAERQIMTQMLFVGYSISQIATHFKRHKQTIQLWIKRWLKDEPLADKPRSGRPRILSDIEVWAVMGGLQVSGFTTLDKMIEDYKLNCKSRILAKRRHEFHIYRMKAIQKPLLQEHHKAARIRWCEQMLQWSDDDLNNIIYTDEKMFYSCRSGPPFVWRMFGTESDEHRLFQDRTARYKCNVFAAIHWTGQVHLEVRPSKQNSEMYKEMCERGKNQVYKS